MGGNWTEADLAGYRVVERQPIVGHYAAARIVSAPPPSSGSIARPRRSTCCRTSNSALPTALQDR
jgi:hypothetical protein